MKALTFLLMFCNVYLMSEGVTFMPDLCNSLLNSTVSVSVPSNQMFVCSIAEYTEYKLEVQLENAEAVMMQIHSLEDKINVSDLLTNDNITGQHVGMLRYTRPTDVNGSWSVQSSVNHTVHTLMMITLFQGNDPVPGACNQIYLPDNEPNLHLNATPDLALIKFAAANVGFQNDSYPPSCDMKSTSPAMNLLYDLYVYYMPNKDYTRNTMFDAVEKMATPEAVEKHGQKVSSFKELQKKEVYMALFKNRGIVYNVLVYDPILKTSSAYAPLVSYACDENSEGSSVCTYTDMGPTLVYTVCGLLGVILCFLGHWTFLYEMYMFGFLPSLLGFFMIFTANTDLKFYGIFTASVTLGCAGGATSVGLWWRFGRVTPTVLWISLVLGFQLASVLFFTPFGYLSVWESNASFGLAFASFMLLAPTFGLVCQLWVSIITCAVIGSYMMIVTMSFFLGGILQYITQNIANRASAENFDQAVHVLPGNPIDYILAALWLIFALCGVATQKYLTRKERDFPTCPYKSFKERRRLLRLRNRETSSTVAITSGTVNSSDSERKPLVGDL